MALTINMIGDFQVLADGVPVALPPSRKTRALFAYLAATGATMRRERLCEMFWNIPDDPKGALRWSLSKIRGILGDAERGRLRADRESVHLETAGLETDIGALRAVDEAGIASLDAGRLEALAALFRGEFLEGLDLPNAHSFHGWCLAERETMRMQRKSILLALLAKLSHDASQALPYARRLVDIEPLDEDLRAQLIRMLVAAGRSGEANAVYRSGLTLADDFDVPVSSTLAVAGWQIGQVQSRPAVPATVPLPGATQTSTSFVGRDELLAELQEALTAAAAGARLVLVHGEPGIGKTRLLEEFLNQVVKRGGRAIKGTAIESRWGRPYAPWIDALAGISAAEARSTLPTDLSEVLTGIDGRSPGQGKQGLFDSVDHAVTDWASGTGPAVLVFDDVHWLDEASVELLHHVVHANSAAPVLFLLGGRSGEMHDNEPLQEAMRSFRREGRLNEIELAPLAAEAVADLAATIAEGVDTGQVFAGSGGNPLIAIEMARALGHGKVTESRSLADLVHDRIEVLPDEAADVLRWCSVLGDQPDLETIDRVLPHTPAQTAQAIEILERHGILRAVHDAAGRPGYRFAHSVFRQIAYRDMSEPRRRLMHRHVAQALSGDEDIDAAATAYHAALAGDGAMAARACVTAGRNCLRQFANGEAAQLARRGLHYVEGLRGTERVKLAIELLEISLAAKRPDDPESTARSLRDLADHALDLGCPEHARLGYHLLSYLRWDQGEWTEAYLQMAQARAAAHAGDSLTNALSLAEMSRCLVLLDRDIPQADAMLMEADALAGQAGRDSHVFALARGMLQSRRGEWDSAAAELNRARALARAAGDRVDEFAALEDLSVIALRRGRFVDAQILCRDLVDLSGKIREGSEQPFAHAMKTLADWFAGEPAAQSRLDATVAELRDADAKHRLAVVLMLASELHIRDGDPVRALAFARDALDLARALNRPSDEVFARVAIARAALAGGDVATARAEMKAVPPATAERMSVPAGDALKRLRSDLEETGIEGG